MRVMILKRMVIARQAKLYCNWRVFLTGGLQQFWGVQGSRKTTSLNAHQAKLNMFEPALANVKPFVASFAEHIASDTVSQKFRARRGL